MAFADLMNGKVRIRSAQGTGPVDQYNNPTNTINTKDVVATIQQHSARAGTSSSREGGILGEVVSTGYTLFLPAGTAIDAGDQVDDLKGSVYEVVGDPVRVTSLHTHSEHHVEAQIKHTGGTG